MTTFSIHIISTINGQVNEGMRNVATHLASSFEKKDCFVKYSGLKDVASIIKNSIACDATMIFARANKMVYWMSRIVCLFSKNVWVVCVQKPDPNFIAFVHNHPLKVNYLAIVKKDLDEIKVQSGYQKELFDVGINADKFSPVDGEKQKQLKKKYGINADRPLVIHVGHCSAGRGLEDFLTITDAERMIVASGMFENSETVRILEDAGVNIHKGYLDHVEEIYQMADAYLFPTRSTEFVISIPLSVMEALSCGVPVVAYNDFDNLKAISAKENAVTLIKDKGELNATVLDATKRKSNQSYLREPQTWDQVADYVMSIVKRG